MSKGQMAMIAAMGLPLEPNGQPSNADKGRTKAARSAGVPPARVSQALLVRDHAPHLVAEVIAGTVSLGRQNS